MPPAVAQQAPCLTCETTIQPTPGGSFTGTLVLPAPGGGATTVGGRPSGSSSGGGCGDCYSTLSPACGNGASTCLGANADQCLEDGGSPMVVLFWDPPSTQADITGYVCLQPGQQPVSVDDISDEVRTFVDELVPRDPQVVVQPAGDALVRVPTLVRAAMSTAPVTRRFFTGSGFAVDVTAKPVRWDWTFGEGPVQRYGYPGAAYDGVDPTTTGRHVTHTYATGGDRQVSVTVVWTAEYRLAGVGTVPVGEVRRPSTPVQVSVRTARSQLVRP